MNSVLVKDGLSLAKIKIIAYDLDGTFLDDKKEIPEENLRYLSENGYTGKCLIRLPLIPSFNNEDDVTASEDILKGMGFTRFNRFKYKEK